MATELFKTQAAYRPYFLKSFVRPNELFSVNLDRGLDISDPKIISGSFTYALTKDQFQLQFHCPEWFQRKFPLEVFIFGYKKGIPFGQMTKTVIKLSQEGQAIFNAYTPLRAAKIKIILADNTISILCPLEALENPEKILTSVKASYNPWSAHLGQWKILTVHSAQNESSK